MKSLFVLILFVLVYVGCQKAVDPRDQYIANYNATLSGVTVDSVNHKTYDTGTSEVLLIVSKGNQRNELSLLYQGDQHALVATLTGNTFTIAKSSFEYRDASGKVPQIYTVEGQGSFDANKLEMTTLSTVKGASTTLQVKATRK